MGASCWTLSIRIAARVTSTSLQMTHRFGRLHIARLCGSRVKSASLKLCNERSMACSCFNYSTLWPNVSHLGLHIWQLSSADLWGFNTQVSVLLDRLDRLANVATPAAKQRLWATLHRSATTFRWPHCRCSRIFRG